MNKFRFLFTLMASALLLFASCEKEEEVKVEFKNPAYQLKVGETLALSDELKVSNSDQKPEWMSSDETVASVDAEGVLTALSTGETNVTAIVEGKEASCVIQVSDILAEKITLIAPESLEAEGAWGNIKAAVDPEGYNNDNLVWTFTAGAEGLEFDTEKVSAAEYKVKFKTFVEGGKLTVKVADANSDVFQTVDIVVTEKVIAATKISLTMPEELTEGDDVWGSVKAEVTPAEYDPEHLVWEFEPSSADLGFKFEKVSATEYKVRFSTYVEGGNVLVKVSDELSETFNQGTIKVIEKPFEGVLELKVSPTTLSLNVGDEPVALQMTYSPADYDLNLLEWSTSDKAVATVADGVVTPVADGEAVIAVKDKVSGKEASCKVTVTTPVKEALVKEIVLNETNLNLRVGEEAVQLIATCYDTDGKVIENYAGLVWSADLMPGENGKEITVVEVSQKGIVTPKNAGTTIVVVTDVDNPQARAVCNVAVIAAEVKVEEVKLLPASKTIDIAETFDLTVVITPDNAENKSLTFTSSDEKIAKVDGKGTVTGVAYGEAVITAKAANGVKGECTVTVASSKIDVTEVVLNEKEITMVVGKEKTLTATVSPENATDKEVVWTTSDEKIATVENGKIKAVKEGVATITATADGKSATCKVTVEKVAVTEVSLNATSRGMDVNQTFRLTATVTPEDATYPEVTWKSSNEKVATVDATGLVKSLTEGKATITATADGKSATCEITVEIPVIEATDITITADKTEAKPGETITLKATLLPEGAEGTVNWESGNAAIATVEGGVVTIKAFIPGEDGKCTVDIKVSVGDISESITLTVNPIEVEAVTIDPATLTLVKKQSKELSYTVSPEDATVTSVEWKVIKGSDLVSVDAEGNVTATAMGKGAQVQVLVNGTKSAVCTVDVEGIEPTGITLSPSTLNLTEESTYEGFTYVVSPSDCDFKEVTWSSSNTDIATVDKNGKVTAIKDGDAVITVTTVKGGFTSSCDLTVKDIEFEITITPEDKEVLTAGLMQDKSVKLNAFYTREDNGKAFVPAVTGWSSSDETIATVDADGNVTAVIEHIDESGYANGKKVVITHTADKAEKSIELTVVKALPEQIIMTAVPSVNGEYYKMMHGDTFTFEAKVLPEKALQDVWYAGGEWLQVPNNTYTATTVGPVEFTAYAADNTNVRLRFTIDVLPVVLTDMNLNRTSIDMITGSEASLTVSFTPSNASFKTITWSSSDESVVAVDDRGTVRAVGAGNAVITALQADNNISRTCEVTVKDPDRTFKVGNYYYSSGKVSSITNEDEAEYGKVIGVIFSVNNPTLMGDDKLAADYPECVNGYVVSTAEYTSALHNYDFLKSAFASWTSSNGYDLTTTSSATGYTNTIACQEYANADFTLFDSTNGPVAKHRSAVAVPDGVTPWYMPSFKEMQMLYENLSSVNEALAKVSEGVQITTSNPYWQSTYYADQWGQFSNHAFDMNNGGWTSAIKGNDEELPVRVILAF